MGTFNQKPWTQQYQNRLWNVLQKIKRQPGISGYELCRATTSMTHVERQGCLIQLASSGDVREEIVRGKGRPTKRYCPILPASPQKPSIQRQDAIGAAPATLDDDAMPPDSEWRGRLKSERTERLEREKEVRELRSKLTYKP
jgi:hypothetical protein